MAAGMVAPLAMALSTTPRPQRFSEPERENGKAAWLLGFSFISEGAIPFAAVDPVRIIASSVVGSSICGALAMAFGIGIRALMAASGCCRSWAASARSCSSSWRSPSAWS